MGTVGTGVASLIDPRRGHPTSGTPRLDRSGTRTAEHAHGAGRLVPEGGSMSVDEIMTDVAWATWDGGMALLAVMR